MIFEVVCKSASLGIFLLIEAVARCVQFAYWMVRSQDYNGTSKCGPICPPPSHWVFTARRQPAHAMVPSRLIYERRWEHWL